MITSKIYAEHKFQYNRKFLEVIDFIYNDNANGRT